MRSLKLYIGSIFTVVAILISVNLSFSTPSEKDCSGYVTILLYHKFDEPDSPSTSVSSELFRQHLQYLRDHNYNVISIEALSSLLKNPQSIPPKTVVITIDDGYRSVYEKAFPLLKEFGFPFTVFLYMEAVDRYPDYMTKAQISEMSRYRGTTFGNHSYSHGRFGTMDEEAVMDDLLRSEKRFFNLLGYRPRYFAYPYGEYSAEVVQILRHRGYHAAFTQDPFSVSCRADPMLLPRVPLVGSWSSLKKLREFLELEPLDVLSHEPVYGLLKENPPERISFVVSRPDLYQDFKIYISELGWLDPVIRGNTVYVEDIPFLKRKINRVALKAKNRETKRKAMFYFMIIAD